MPSTTQIVVKKGAGWWGVGGGVGVSRSRFTGINELNSHLFLVSRKLTMQNRASRIQVTIPQPRTNYLRNSFRYTVVLFCAIVFLKL